MQFITTGNRIAVENFVLGDLYTITFTSGIYINSACIGIGENFVSFQRNEPELLFTLNMETAELVSSIDLYAGGTGTNNYNDLTNKPQINDVDLVGNKSLSDLGIQETISDIDTIRSGAAAGATAVQPDALSDYQPVISDLGTIRAGAAAGATAVQPADMTAALALKQDALNTAQLNAVNSGITSTDVVQIELNKNNILYNTNTGVKNVLKNGAVSTGIFTVNADGTVIANGSTGGSAANLTLQSLTAAEAYALNGKILSGCPSGGSDSTYRLFIQRNSSPWNVYVRDFGEGATISGIPETACLIILSVAANQTVDNLKFSPMIRAFGDNTYQPYALSNAELTEEVIPLTKGIKLVAHTSNNGNTSLSYDTNINDFDIGSNTDKNSGVYLIVCNNWSTTPAPYIGLLTFSGATTNHFVKTDVVTGFTPTISITENTANATIAISGAAKISIYAVR